MTSFTDVTHRLRVAAIVERARVAAPRDGRLVHHLVKAIGGDAGYHMRCHLEEDLGCCPTGTTHASDLVVGSDIG
jgi:hypothetical protein